MSEKPEKEPEMAEFGPIWWVSHGTKMRVVEDECGKNVLVIRGSAAEVKITKMPGTDSGWLIEYRIDHGGYCQSNGQVWMNESELAAAFRLRDDHENSKLWLIRRYGGTVAIQRLFIRYREFLNIPGPGTGYQGDSNVSIKLYPETILAVHKLILSTPPG